MARKTYNWYISQNLKPPTNLKPKVKGYERKTYNWYVQRGLTPPEHLSKPKVVKDTVGNLMQFPAPINQPASTVVLPVVETEAEIEARIKTRFGVLEALVDDVIEGDVRALIVSGPPGLGKSYTVETALKDVENCRIVKGHSSAKGLYDLLYDYRDENSIVVFDDADSIFTDEKALNLLKTALDTTEERVLSWLTSGPFGQGSSEDNAVPTSYVFNGSIIFITNLDFDGMIARQNKISKHLEALVSRAHYIDLMMKSARDYVTRIKQVIRDTNMLADLSKEATADVVQFIEWHQSSLREISLRTALKVGALRKSNKDNWQDVARITCCKVV